MSIELIRSAAQLKYEVEKTEQELTSLLHNWQQKKTASFTKIQVFRAEIKELDAVLAETERGYLAYQLVLNPLATFAQTDPTQLHKALADLANTYPAVAACFSNLRQAANEITQPEEGTETYRVLQARETHKIATENRQRKSKEIYAALQAEKKSVEEYAAHLTAIIRDKNQQFQIQVKTNGLGL